jgi:hypothetical protein
MRKGMASGPQSRLLTQRQLVHLFLIRADSGASPKLHLVATGLQVDGHALQCDIGVMLLQFGVHCPKAAVPGLPVDSVDEVEPEFQDIIIEKF